MKKIFFAAAGIAALGYAASRVPWGKVKSALVEAEGEYGPLLKEKFDSLRSNVREIASAIVEEPTFASDRKSGRSSTTLHS